MTTVQLPVMSSKEAAIAIYVEQIRKYIGDATNSWRRIADIFANASDEFGFTSYKMDSLMKQTGCSKSKTSKLISISKSKRLRDHDKKFCSTEAWTVLYEVTKMTDAEFQTLIDRLGDAEIVTQRKVDSAKTKTVSEVDPYKTVFTIQIDINAIKSDSFDGSDYSELHDRIQDILNPFKHVRAVETSVFENDVAQFFAELEREFDRQVRKEFSVAMKEYLSRVKDKNHFGLYTKEELKDLMRLKNFEEAFSAIDSDRFDRGRLYRVAEQEVCKKRRNKFVPKMGRNEECANTAIQITG